MVPGHLGSLEVVTEKAKGTGRGIMLLTLIAEAAPSSLLAFTRDATLTSALGWCCNLEALRA